MIVNLILCCSKNVHAVALRPIPFTPVTVNALSGAKDKYLWGTNIEGKLMELGLAQPRADLSSEK